MMELFTLWRNTRMIVLVAVSAAAYAAILLPFKGFALIPGLIEMRPGAAIPIVMSFLFGPAAAWGSAFGNLIGDVLGSTLSPGSVFGFAGNFIYGYLPYALWRALMGQASPVASGRKGGLVFAMILGVVCLAIASVIGWGLDLLKLAPFRPAGIMIAANNLIACATISTILISLLYARIHNWGILYFQILDEEPGELPHEFPGQSAEAAGAARIGEAAKRNPPRGKIKLLGAVLCINGALLSFGCGAFPSFFGCGATGAFSVELGMLPGLLMLLGGAALL
ncbi:MAG: QueT transporter family protein [Candidatus Sumerlaeota bacterium]|nr:QueT transporter family protein [Candidatus Sumerlaeota bacterium]